MGIYPFKKIVFNCKQATLLSLKKEQGKISFIEKIKLAYHLFYCDPCQHFIKHSHIINKVGKGYEDALSNNPPLKLQKK